MSLKMTPEHVAQLTAAIQEVRRENPGASAATYVAEGYTEKRYRWDLLYAARLDGLRGPEWICRELYKYLNDDHIDSALRLIVKGLDDQTERP